MRGVSIEYALGLREQRGDELHLREGVLGQRRGAVRGVWTRDVQGLERVIRVRAVCGGEV